MARWVDPKYFNSMIDGNVLTRTGGVEDAEVDCMLDIIEAGDFIVLLPYSVKAEIAHPNTPPEKKGRAARLIYSEPVQLTSPEQERLRKVCAILRGDAEADRHDADAFHVIEARVAVTSSRAMADGREARRDQTSGAVRDRHTEEDFIEVCERSRKKAEGT